MYAFSAEQSGTPTHRATCGTIVCELACETHKDLFASIDARILPVCGDEIVGAALAQVAVEQDAKPILTQFLTVDGPELCVLPAAAIIHPPVSVPVNCDTEPCYVHGGDAVYRSTLSARLTWGDVVRHTRSVGMVAVGFIDPCGECVLNPRQTQDARIWVNHKLILLAD